jgi:hypothetical protein
MTTVRQDETLTDRHYETLREFSRAGGPLRTEAPTATTNWSDAYIATVPSPERRAFQRAILDRIPQPDGAENPVIIVTAGPPAAGKTRAVDSEVVRSGIPRDQWVLADPDRLKDLILKALVADGSYRQRLLPREVTDREDVGEIFFRREMASLVHEESSQIDKDLIRRTLLDGACLVIDGVLANEASARYTLKRVAVTDADYTVSLVVVDCTREVSRIRGRRRWERGYLQALDAVSQGADRDQQPGGRFVPSEFRTLVFPPGRPTSASVNVALAMAWEFPIVTSFAYHWAPEDEAARLVFSEEREPGAPWTRLPSFTPGPPKSVINNH